MAKAINKTKATNDSVEDFINAIADEQKREDTKVITEMMQKATKEEPKLWSNSMIGFGEIVVKTPTSGREVDWLRMGFAPRKTNLSLYLTGDIKKNYGTQLEKLGKHKTGMGCLYINKLADVDVKVLNEMIKESAKKK